jgi:Ser/Thr protein kinase RdoA (MazF antagonist)
MSTGEGTPLEELARDVLRRWQLDGEPERVDIGVNKVTWKIGDSFWLSSDFTSAQEDTTRLEGLLTRVAAEFGDSIAVPRFVPSPSGTVLEAGGRVWWVTRHVDGRHPDPASEPDMMAVAQGLAVMHEALSHVPREYAVSGDTCEGLFRAGEELVGDERLQFTPDDLDSARHSADLVLKNLDTVLARGMQLTHGDPSNPNLFLSGSPARLTGAIDWDYARFDLVLSDVAKRTPRNSAAW